MPQQASCLLRRTPGFRSIQPRPVQAAKTQHCPRPVPTVPNCCDPATSLCMTGLQWLDTAPEPEVPRHPSTAWGSMLWISRYLSHLHELRETPQNPTHDSKPPARLQLNGQKGPVVHVSHKHIFILLSNPRCGHELQDTWGLSRCHPEMCIRAKPWRAFLTPALSAATPAPGQPRDGQYQEHSL